jgi:hypothetical protein
VYFHLLFNPIPLASLASMVTKSVEIGMLPFVPKPNPGLMFPHILSNPIPVSYSTSLATMNPWKLVCQEDFHFLFSTAIMFYLFK